MTSSEVLDLLGRISAGHRSHDGQRSLLLRQPCLPGGPGTHVGRPEANGTPHPHYRDLPSGDQRPREGPPHPEVLLQIVDRPERLIRDPQSTGVPHGASPTTRVCQRSLCEQIPCPATAVLTAERQGSPNSRALGAPSKQTRPGSRTTLTRPGCASQLRAPWLRPGSLDDLLGRSRSPRWGCLPPRPFGGASGARCRLRSHLVAPGSRRPRAQCAPVQLRGLELRPSRPGWRRSPPAPG